MSSPIPNSKHLDAVKEYFTRGDNGRHDLFELLADDVQFYFPKFGIGIGKAQFLEFATGLMSSIKSIAHDLDTMKFFEGNSFVVAEGVTSGSYHDGAVWSGGQTPGGRFCSIFEFDDHDQIKRLHIYLDPDYTGNDKNRFLWSEDRSW